LGIEDPDDDEELVQKILQQEEAIKHLRAMLGDRDIANRELTVQLAATSKERDGKHFLFPGRWLSVLHPIP
jgi:hypothetical protein